MSDTPESVGYKPLPDLISGTPATQNGIVPDLGSDVGPQSARIAADPVLMAGAPSGPDGTPVNPGGGAENGAGSIGPIVDGWHPASDE